MNAALEAWRMEWQRAGAAVIPVWPNSKTPVCEAWNIEPPALQWQRAGGADFKGNIGARPGSGLACLDADESRTVENLTAFLAGLGIAPPYERTPSGGVHFWLPLAGGPSDVNAANLAPQVGRGELRTRKTNVVVSCSAIGRRRYHFERGGPADIGKLRAVSWADLRPLLSSDGAAELLTAPPLPLLRRPMPAKTRQLLADLRAAERGRTVAGYPSRSEAEAAVVASLILCGFELADIGQVFEEWKPGHYQEYSERHKAKYLRRSYAKVLTALASSEERQSIAADYRAALEAAWPGRGGPLERLVYLGLLSRAWADNRRADFHAAELDLAQMAAASQRGVNNALHRLRAKRLVARAERGSVNFATSYRLLPFAAPAATPAPATSANTTPLNCDLLALNTHFELWGRGALGRTAGEVYARLTAESQRAGELARLTGRGRWAVHKALKTLAAHGLAENAGGWKRGAADVGAVAADFDASGRARLRRARIERQREGFAELKRRAKNSVQSL